MKRDNLKIALLDLCKISAGENPQMKRNGFRAVNDRPQDTGSLVCTDVLPSSNRTNRPAITDSLNKDDYKVK